MENMKVKNVVISKQPENSKSFQDFKIILKNKKTNIITVGKGDKINIEKNLYINILWPDTKNFISENALNNNSLVFKLVYKNFSCIFTGDIEEIAEKAILQEYSSNLKLLKSDIIKVAHHGSKSSSTTEFLDAINPKIALIGVGKNNTFGHPSLEIINRLKKRKIKIFRTDQNGEIEITINNEIIIQKRII